MIIDFDNERTHYFTETLRKRTTEQMKKKEEKHFEANE